MPSKKRPGVQAGIHLVALDDAKVWEKVEHHGREVFKSFVGLEELEGKLAQLAQQASISKSDLEFFVNWKHTVGKKRIYNRKHLFSNSEDNIVQFSQAAMQRARELQVDECCEDDGSLSADGKQLIQEAIRDLERLNGVGPATASAILSLVRPDLFAYMYDEVIDSFEPQREYKINNYLRVNSRCLQIAKTLGSGWTPFRVAKTIWLAARFLALHGEDLTELRGALVDEGALEDLEGEDEDDTLEDDDDEEEETASGDEEETARDARARKRRRSSA